MKTKRTFKVKLYKTRRQNHLHRQVHVACAIYNHCIQLHRRYYSRYGKSLHKYQLQKHLTKVKKRKVWWKELGSQAIQDVTERIDKGYKLFFRNIKAGIVSSPPRFKGKHTYRSFTLKQAGWSVEGNKLRVGDQTFKFSKSRELEGTVKTVTLKRDALGDFYAFFVCEVEDQPSRVTSGKNVGFDFGLKKFLTSDDGGVIESPQFFKSSLAAVKRANKKLSSKKKGSNNRKKAKMVLARTHKKIANRRNDFHHKLARELAICYDNIFVEDLDLGAMKKRWGRKISDLSFFSFLKILEHHCNKAGSNLQKVPRYFPSSKTCSNCNYILETLTLRQRSWTCPKCSSFHNRDQNAAKNIFRVGASTLREEVVRNSSEFVLLRS